MSSAKLVNPTPSQTSAAQAPITISRPAQSAFAISRMRSESAMQQPVGNPLEPGVIVCITMTPLPVGLYRMWLRGKAMSLPHIDSYRTNVIPVEAEPCCWIGRGFEYLHFFIPQREIDGLARDLGFHPVSSYRLALNEEDLVVAQIARTLRRHPGAQSWPPALVIDHMSLVLGAHVLQRYAIADRGLATARGGLAPWQQRRATELLRENLDGNVRLAELARECHLSISHFARSFKASFGTSPQRWLRRQRMEVAKQLLHQTDLPLVDVAAQTGFSDQPAFTRAFQRVTGLSPGRWRRQTQG
jgi:AraC family transcriptional regulator